MSEEENIFDLTKLTSHKNEEEVKKEVAIVTTGMQEQMLHGYIEVPKDQWNTIPHMARIRYLRLDGNFRKGGIIRDITISSYGKTKGKMCFQLASSMHYKSTGWNVCFDSLDKVWKQNDCTVSPAPPAVVRGDSTEIKSLTEEVNHLKLMVEQLKVEVANEQNEKKRIINLIKKLHNIR